MFTFLPPRFPFMLHDHHTIRADVYPLGKVYNDQLETEHFLLDSQFEDYIREKLRLLASDAPHRRLIAESDADGLRAALMRVWHLLERDAPEVVQIVGDEIRLSRYGIRLAGDSLHTDPKNALGEQVAAHLASVTGNTRLADALALTCQEDIVILHGDCAELLHVCFPSHWRPAEKFQHSFARIHDPVADNARLQDASQKLMHAMIHKKAYIRFAWTLGFDADLDNHPDKPAPDVSHIDLRNPQQVAENAYFRMERQTTFPMPDLNRALFTIRIYRQPLTDAVQNPIYRQRLTHILQTIDPQVAAYKSLTPLIPPLLAWLQDFPT